jgi:hypothetical protein
MALAVRRSILMKSLPVVVCLFGLVCFTSTPALAQHPGGRVAAAPAPPMIHAPVYRAPSYQTPIYRNPSYVPAYAPHVSTGSRGIGALIFRPPFRPRPFPPILRFYIFPVSPGAFWPSNFCWWATCDYFWTSALLYNSAPLDVWNPANSLPQPPFQTPVYVYGEETPDNPELFLKDGTSLFVSDYWVVDDQLHFMITQDDGMKPEEQVIPVDELDLQKTVDVNTNRGFRFLLRNEPFEQYVRDHPEGPPASAIPEHH